MNVKTALGVIVVAVLFFFSIVLLFFGVIFAIASSVDNPTTRLNTAIMMFVAAIALFIVGIIIAYYITRKPRTIIQKLEVSGEMKAVGLKCPNCGGSVEASNIKIVSGVPYATCAYCGHTFEVAEEPKW